MTRRDIEEFHDFFITPLSRRLRIGSWDLKTPYLSTHHHLHPCLVASSLHSSILSSLLKLVSRSSLKTYFSPFLSSCL